MMRILPFTFGNIHGISNHSSLKSFSEEHSHTFNSSNPSFVGVTGVDDSVSNTSDDSEENTDLGELEGEIDGEYAVEVAFDGRFDDDDADAALMSLKQPETSISL